MHIRNLKLVSHLSAYFEHPITFSFIFNLDKLPSVAASSKR